MEAGIELSFLHHCLHPLTRVEHRSPGGNYSHKHKIPDIKSVLLQKCTGWSYKPITRFPLLNWHFIGQQTMPQLLLRTCENHLLAFSTHLPLQLLATPPGYFSSSHPPRCSMSTHSCFFLWIVFPLLSLTKYSITC
jgi:hypothetical protein